MELEPIDYNDIDENMRTLIKALNDNPAIHTFECCGGHKNPIHSQRPLGEWWVFLEYRPNQQGWEAIELISYALWLIEQKGKGYHEFNHQFSRGRYIFLLRGYESNPNKLATKITELNKELDNNRK